MMCEWGILGSYCEEEKENDKQAETGQDIEIYIR